MQLSDGTERDAGAAAGVALSPWAAWRRPVATAAGRSSATPRACDALPRCWMRRNRPWRAWILIAWAFAGAGLIADGWEHGLAETFALGIAPTLVVHLLVSGAGRSAIVERQAWRQAALAVTGALHLTDQTRLLGL